MSSGIRTIAKQLNVAPSSVSRALAGKPGVSEKLRKKILSLAGALAYAPSPMASSLRSGKGQGLVIITATQPTQISSVRTRMLFEKAQHSFGGVRLHVKSQDESIDEAVRRALAWGPAAIITSSLEGALRNETSARLREREVPLVSMDGEIPGHDAIVIERSTGVSQAARLILLSGREQPLFLSQATLQDPDDRLIGARHGFESLGRRFEERYVRQALKIREKSAPAIGFESARQILESSSSDAIFCYSDEMAVGVLRYLLAVGVRVPEDIMVVGFDDLPVAEYLTPSLTTVAQPVEEAATAAIAAVADRAGAFDVPPRRLVLQTRLIIRESAPASPSIKKKVFADKAISVLKK
jgi:DNA-binding LacI/PurR family transcriptional regulator